MLTEVVGDIVARHAANEGPLLPILHELQAAQGFIAEADVSTIAAGLNLSRAEVSGVVGFYHDFRRAPRTLPAIQVCRAEACQARGAEPLAIWAESAAQGRVTIETIYCLGLCTVGPAAMLDHEVYARLDRETMGELIEAALA